MNTILKKLISGVLAVVMMFTCFPVAAFAATTTTEDSDSVEMDDGYISVSVSKENGGFLVDTLLGNQLKSSDDSKNLLFPSAGYDTSFTSFQVTRTDGGVEEYVFGRQYGFLGISSTAVKTEVKGSSIVSTWSVKDLTIVQTLSFVDETNPMHGQVDITYDVTTTANDVANVKARIMLDTALGSQDYGMYQLHSADQGYDLITKEALIEDAYDNVLMAVCADGTSPVTAYTVNAVVDGVEQKPYQVAFGHWANLASTVFGFAPDVTRPAFNVPKDGKYRTADSAYALYFDLGEIKKDSTASVSTYYGVYSNVTVSEGESVAVNFTQLPNSMTVKDGSTLESASYHSQVEGGKDGDIEVRLVVENLTDSVLLNPTVVVKTMNNVYTYTGDYPSDTAKSDGGREITVDRINDGDSAAVSFFFNVTPLNYSEYRYFEIEVYSSSGSLLGSNGFYLLCPSVLGEEVSFNTTNPQTIYVEGSRNLYISGENFRLLQDTSDYVAYLRPVGDTGTDAVAAASANARTVSTGASASSEGTGIATSAVIPGTNIVINTGENTMNILVENALEPGVYELVLDWVEDDKGETTSRMLLVHVSDDPAYKMPTYGIVTVERTPEYTRDDPTYQLGVYKTEAEYKATWDKIKEESDGKRNIYEEVLLEFRGDFTMVMDEESDTLSLTATSVENPNGTVSGSINISNAIEVEGGYVTLRVEHPGQENQCIYTDIDGYVFTSGERTTVWDGVCAITPIANGEINQLVQYYEDGSVDDSIENTTALANTISLLWPAAAGTAQTICGIFFDLRYCEFGTIATEYCDKSLPIPDDVERHRVVAFSAVIDPSFLLPTDFLMGERELNNMELAQRTFAKKNYTADQLVEVDKKYKSDMKKWFMAQGGSLVLAVQNILFGDNRFIGFDASLSVGIPSYFEGIGGIEGTLSIAIFNLDPSEAVYTKFGVDGAIDLETFMVEATLVLKSINGIPIPDELYLYVGGFTPGLNVDGCGVFWITGAGGGFSNLYESIVSKSKVPAFSVSLEGGFSLFQILFARLKLTLSARGFAAQLKDLGLNQSYSASSNLPQSGMHGDADVLTIIPSMGFAIYWYPKFQASAHIEVNVLSIATGGGYIVLEENTESGKVFFEALATCTVQVPNIPLVGTVTLGGVDIGVDVDRIYGALHVLKLDMGLCYYYGGDVDFSFGKYDVPTPTLLSAKVGELSTGEPVILAFGTNITQVASTEGGVVQLGSVTRLDSKTPAIVSATDRMHHQISLGDYAEGDRALTITYTAENLDEARAIAKGGLFSEGLTLTSADGTRTYELEWLDVTDEVLDPETADSANALLNYDEESKEAIVTISFTNEEDYQTAWQLTTAAPCELVLYSLTRLADIETVGFNANTKTVSWTGSELADFDKIIVLAIAEDGTAYPLYETENTDEIQSGSAVVAVPESMPSGSYTIQLSARDEEGNVSDVESAADTWNYINPKQPASPSVSNARLGGDYTIDVDVAAKGSVEYTGYTTVIEEYDPETEQWVESDFAQQDFGPDETTLAVGGCYTSTTFIKKAAEEGEEDETITYSDYMAMSDEEKAEVTVVNGEIGLAAGTRYRVRVNAYVITENLEILYSEDQYTDELTMVEPDPAQVTVTGINAKSITEENSLGEEVTRDVYTQDTVTLKLTADQAAHVVWKLDEGSISGEGDIAADGSLVIELPGTSSDEDTPAALNQGEHSIRLFITNEAGDESTGIYSFRVDSDAPKLQISSPQTGSFYDDTVTVTGISEPGATVTILLDGKEYATVVVPETVHEKDAQGNVTIVEGGHFSVDVEMDTTVYEQTVSVIARDAVGNETQQFDLILVNKLITQQASELAIYLNGQDVTGQTIPAGSEGVLELRYVQRDENGLPVISVAVPSNSMQGSMAYWDAYIVEGYGSVTRDGDILLDTSTDVNGMLTVTVDQQQVCAVLGGNSMRDKSVCQITLPEDPEGYSITTEDNPKIFIGSDFSFQVSVNEGYDSADMKVYANNVELTAVDGVYTVTNVMTDVKISVTGVADKTAPEVTVIVAENAWTKFLNTITFGLFFNKTQDAKITATDAGSGVYGVYYHISTKPIAQSALETTAWQAYTSKVKLDPDGAYIVYAKVVDNAGNIRYASSDGLVLDATAPSVSGIEDGGVYTGEVTFTVQDDYIDTVTINGKVVEGSVFTLSPADEAQTIVITDKAGNQITINVTVQEASEPDEPVCDGINDCPSTAFPDLDTSAWYHLYTDYIIRAKLMQGYDDGTFRPDEKLSRAMLVQVLYNQEGRPAVSGEDSYTDTNEGSWYSDAILWGTEKGIINGYGGGLFGPDDPVTREQMAAIFYRYSSMKGYSLAEGSYDYFTDKDSVSGYAEAAMRWAVGNGLLIGMGDGTLCPKCNTTRAEFAAMLQRFLENLAK